MPSQTLCCTLRHVGVSPGRHWGGVCVPWICMQGEGRLPAPGLGPGDTPASSQQQDWAGLRQCLGGKWGGGCYGVSSSHLKKKKKNHHSPRSQCHHCPPLAQPAARNRPAQPRAPSLQGAVYPCPVQKSMGAHVPHASPKGVSSSGELPCSLPPAPNMLPVAVPHPAPAGQSLPLPTPYLTVETSTCTHPLLPTELSARH